MIAIGARSTTRADRHLTEATLSYLFIVLACIGLALFLGKDVSWDQRHFHFYLGYSALHDRISKDFYPASVQSYNVPYAFAPFYLLASSGLSDRLVVAALALLPAAALCLVWQIGGRIVGDVTGRHFDRLGAWLSVALAAGAPIFLFQLGNSFIDLPTAVPVLLAIVLVLPRAQLEKEQTQGKFALAGALLGFACALKLSNVVSAIGVLCFLLLLTQGWRAKIHASITLATSMAASALAVAGFWWWRVYSEYGNPVLPGFNGIFKSDAAEVSGGTMVRFIPVDLLDALLRPIWMMSPEKAVYIDVPAPDARFFFLIILLLCCLVYWLVKLASGKQVDLYSEFQTRRLFWSLFAGLIVSWPIWLMTSGNGRYYSPWFLLVGPLSIALLWRVSGKARFKVYGVATMIAVQGYIVATGSLLRYHPVDWSATGEWFDVKVPKPLQDPAIYFSMGLESASLAFPYLHPESTFISAGGQYALATHMPAWRYVQNRLARKAALPMYFIVNVETYAPQDGSYNRPDAKTIDAMVSGLQMRSKANAACEDIWVNGVGVTLAIAPSTKEASPVTLDRRMLVVACPVERIPTRNAHIEKARSAASAVMDDVAARCPLLFPSPAPFTFYNGHFWTRQYAASDTVLIVDDIGVSYFRPNFYQTYRVGSLEQVRAGNFSVSCDYRREPLPIARS